MPSPSACSADHCAPVRVDQVVLDTNVVLDWLLFRDGSCAALAARLDARQLRWCATEAMRAELASVLPRPQLQQWLRRDLQLLEVFDERAVLLPAAAPLIQAAGLRCRDADDQKFIDLACAIGARWLLTRDRALLDLHRAARVHGVEVLRPSDWARRYGAEAQSGAPAD